MSGTVLGACGISVKKIGKKPAVTVLTLVEGGDEDSLKKKKKKSIGTILTAGSGSGVSAAAVWVAPMAWVQSLAQGTSTCQGAGQIKKA